MKTYNWEGVNPDGYFLDKLEPIPSALPSFQKLFQVDRKSGSAGMPRPISYAVFCLKKNGLPCNGKFASVAGNWWRCATGGSWCPDPHDNAAQRSSHRQ